MPRDEGHVRARPEAAEPALAPAAAWLLGVIFGSQSILFYGCITWLASIYVERGWSEAEAGALIALLDRDRPRRRRSPSR